MQPHQVAEPLHIPTLSTLRALRLVATDPIGLFVEVTRQGHIGGFRFGKQQVVLVNEPSYVHAVLTNTNAVIRAPRFVRILRAFLGEGLLTMDGEVHRRHRKLMAPAFHQRRIAEYATTMTDTAEHVVQGWADGAVYDLDQEMMRLALSIVSQALFHNDLGSEAETIRRVLHTLSEHTTRRIQSLISFPNTWPSPRNRKFQQARRQLDTLVASMIQQRRDSMTDEGDLLSMLLNARDEDGYTLSDQELRDELITLIFAGHETTAHTLSWTWYLLSQHPDVYQRLQAEVDHVLGNRTPTLADLSSLRYNLQIIKESMRLYPAAYTIGRYATDNITVGPYTLPKGTAVGMNTYVLHRRAEYFPEPERFNPDRWVPDAEAQLPRGAYIPFALGAHNCIGAQFALMEIQLVLATLVQRVTFELVPRQRIEPEPLITLRPKDGIRVVVRRREHVLH